MGSFTVYPVTSAASEKAKESARISDSYFLSSRNLEFHLLMKIKQ